MSDIADLKYWAQKATAKKQKPRGDTMNLQLRIHPQLIKMLRDAAETNYRSLNGEIAYRLLKSFNEEPK